MAEGVGFEPTKEFNPCRFSRPVHSTALPPLRRTRFSLLAGAVARRGTFRLAKWSHNEAMGYRTTQ